MKMFDAVKTRMIRLPCGEKNYDHNAKPFSSDRPIPERYGRTDRFAISISRVSMLTHDKNGCLRDTLLRDITRP